MAWVFRTGAATRGRAPRRKAAAGNLVLPRSAAEACRLRASSPRRRTRWRTRKLTSSDQATKVVSIAPRTPPPPNEPAHLPGRVRDLGPWESLHAAPVRCSSGFGRLLPPQPFLSRPACGFVGLVADDDRLGRELHHRQA